MHRLLGLAPIFLSLFCIVIVLATSAKFCAPPHVDEGAAAHIFQLIMIAQLPIAVSFVLTRGQKSFVRLLPPLVLQIFAWGVAAATASLMT
ncbi:MAG: hypothetical protein GIW99_02645 [Candidatus Eremiobacteraeota bacterium]|nr:hypothetical protein [Candidatus Eremiobacteraeota bacterium]MBC5826573.1 hypothetical protein [Candidatus Eremiobacteraeota bacterium]